MPHSCRLLFSATIVLAGTISVHAQQRNYPLPGVDLKDRTIWGATCEAPGGLALSFGGQDQVADDGRPHTRIRVKGEWQTIHEELRVRDPLQKYHDRCQALARREKEVTARGRHLYLEGLPAETEAGRVKAEVLPAQEKVSKELGTLVAELRDAAGRLKEYEAGQATQALSILQTALERAKKISGSIADGLRPATVEEMTAVLVALEKAAELLDAEPPPRALSPLVYEPKSKRFVLFGGDHLDYLTNDTWVFDPTARKWTRQRPAAAPPPRANHALKASTDGKVVLSGGYTYSSSTDYLGGQYRDLADGDWTYDVANDTWTGGKGMPSDTRVYRSGPYRPEHYLQGPRPDAAAFAERLRSLRANTWLMTAPPQRPRLNRDWGSAVLDPDRDLILRWSGGHSAHGGTDVLHFHLASNRWELPFPVEFPLGQTYSNTSYPDGFNFNLRPWVTGHTYQSYGYDPIARQMLFTGHTRDCYVYDPTIADWTGRFAKPKGMAYDSSYYTLTLCPTPKGLVAWTRNGELFRFDAGKQSWELLEQRGGRLPGSVVDNSTVVHDSKRNRLVFAVKGYGDKNSYDGELHTFDLESGKVGKLSPRGMGAASVIPYLCQIRYDAEHDLLLVGATLPADASGARRTPAYDCAENRWVSLKLGGDDPNGKSGRNVSLGLMYDARRKVFWAVDAESRVFVVRLDPAAGDMRPLE